MWHMPLKPETKSRKQITNNANKNSTVGLMTVDCLLVTDVYGG